MEETIGFVGIGQMGKEIAKNIAKHLQKSQRELYIYNRTQDSPLVLDILKENNVKLLETAKAVGAKVNIVFTMLLNDKALEEVAAGKDGLLESLKPGSLHVDMSTVYPTTSEKLAETYKAKGIHYISAPVWGRPDAAAAAKLFVVVSGDKAQVTRAEPYLQVVGRKVSNIGEKLSDANKLKIIGNGFLLSMAESLAECIAVSEKVGLGSGPYLDFLKTMFDAPPVIGYATRIAEHNTSAQGGFNSAGGLKDASHFVRLAEEVGIKMKGAEVAKTHLKDAVDGGNSEMDCAMGLSWAVHNDSKELQKN